jgi:uncharacterized lipoprotein
MRFILKNRILVLIFAYLLSGCNLLPTEEFSSNRQHEYLHSKNGKNLVVNQPLTSSNLSDFYQLPNQDQPAKVSIKAPIIDEKK